MPPFEQFDTKVFLAIVLLVGEDSGGEFEDGVVLTLDKDFWQIAITGSAIAKAAAGPIDSPV